MRTRWVHKLSLVTAAVFLLGGYLEASSHAFNVIERIPDRVYVDHNQIRLDRSGIGVTIDGSLKAVSAVFRDKQGYYYEDEHKSCPNCHTAVTLTGDCAVSECSYYYDML
jgi:hypothetical protein